MKVFPEDETTKRLLARTLAARGSQLMREDKPAAALEQFDQALELDPSLEDARQNRDLIKSRLAPQR